MKEAKFKGQEEEEEIEEEEQEQQEEKPIKVIKPKQKTLPINLIKVPTEYGLAFETPEGVMDANQYLAWIGNNLIDLKKQLVGN